MRLHPPPLVLRRALAHQVGFQNAQNEIRWMKQALAHNSGTGTGHGTTPSRLNALLARRIAGEPLQYILGTQPFGPLDILVRPPTLIPRPETEWWALRLADLLAPILPRPTRDDPHPPPLSLLDLCTGTGCIPLLLTESCPRGSLRTVGVDISPHAIALAHENAARCNPHPHPNATSYMQHNSFVPIQADLTDHPALLARLAALAAIQSNSVTTPMATTTTTPSFDVITANPPYIPRDQYNSLDPSVRNWEDPRALLGDPDPNTDDHGLYFYRHIARLANHHRLLKPKGGLLVLEVGDRQALHVRDLMWRDAAPLDVQVWTDPWGKDRVVLVRT